MTPAQDYSQIVLIPKIIAYLRQQKRYRFSETLSRSIQHGICFGMTIQFNFARINNCLSGFFNPLKLLNNWNGADINSFTEQQQNEILAWIEKTLRLNGYNFETDAKYSQNHILAKTSAILPGIIKDRKVISGHFSAADLAKLLSEPCVLNWLEQGMLVLSSIKLSSSIEEASLGSGHAMSIHIHYDTEGLRHWFLYNNGQQESMTLHTEIENLAEGLFNHAHLWKFEFVSLNKEFIPDEELLAFAKSPARQEFDGDIIGLLHPEDQLAALFEGLLDRELDLVVDTTEDRFLSALFAALMLHQKRGCLKSIPPWMVPSLQECFIRNASNPRWLDLFCDQMLKSGGAVLDVVYPIFDNSFELKEKLRITLANPVCKASFIKYANEDTRWTLQWLIGYAPESTSLQAETLFFTANSNPVQHLPAIEKA